MAGGFSNGFSNGFNLFYIVIDNTFLPNGVIAQPYDIQLISNVDSTWSISSGTLPTGLNMNTSGLIDGTPTVVTTGIFEIETNYDTYTSYITYSLEVLPASGVGAAGTWYLPLRRTNLDLIRRK